MARGLLHKLLSILSTLSIDLESKTKTRDTLLSMACYALYIRSIDVVVQFHWKSLAARSR